MSGTRWQARRLTAAPDGLSDQGAGADCWELDSGRPGSHVVVLGGVHGDEPEGALAAGRIAAGDLELRAGLLRVVPVCNEEAFLAASRTTPSDGANLARVFPGDASGTVTQRVADVITGQALADADFLIDLHTAGRRYDMPLMVGCLDDGSAAARASQAAACAFGVDVIWAHPRYSPGRTINVLRERGRPALYAEAPGGEHVDSAVVTAYVRGVRRVLSHLGLLHASTEAVPEQRPRVFTGGGNLDRDVVRLGAGGWWVATVTAGEMVTGGQLLGAVQDVLGQVREEALAPEDGCVMFLRRAALVRPGDVAVCLAQEDAAARARVLAAPANLRAA